MRRHLELSRRQSPPLVLYVPCEPYLEEYFGEACPKEMEFCRIRV
jgi:hypothetical protein